MLVRGARRKETAALHAGPAQPPPSTLRPLLAPLRRYRDRERLRFLKGIPQGARVFEVGSGDGRFLAALAAAGYRAAGSEPFRDPAPEVAARVQIQRAALEELELPPQSQDAVVLWHVLEHLDDPAGALRRVRDWLVPSGRVLVAVPNLASLQARLGGDRWFQLDLPRHLVHFTPEGLARLLQRCGFKEQRQRQLVVEQNVVAMWQTLLNRLTRTPNAAYALVKRRLPAGSGRDVAVSAVAGLPLLAVAVVLELGGAAAGRGGSIVVQARAD